MSRIAVKAMQCDSQPLITFMLQCGVAARWLCLAADIMLSRIVMLTFSAGGALKNRLYPVSRY